MVARSRRSQDVDRGAQRGPVMDPTQKRILLDLAKDYREKMRRGAAHMHEMCELADVPEHEVVGTIYSITLAFVAEIIDQHSDMSAEDFADACAGALRQRRTISRRARSQ
jgi:hypothetical protein